MHLIPIALVCLSCLGFGSGFVNRSEMFRSAEDSDEAFVASPDRKGPRGGGRLFDDMLKKPCPYHKGSVNHTLEQYEMLWKYYNRVMHRNEDKKKEADRR